MKKEPIMSRSERLIYSLLVGVTVVFMVRYVVWWFEPQHIPTNWTVFPFHIADVFIFFLLSFIVFLGSILRLSNWFALWFMAKPRHQSPQLGLKVAFLTCYVPNKEPIDMLENTLRAMKAVRYPHDTWILDEGNDPQVISLCEKLGVRHFSRKGITKFNQKSGKFREKTKAGNHNSWLSLYEKNYDIIAQIDMDHMPKPDYFEKTLGYFRDPKVALVGMPQIYKNTDNWISRGAAEQAFFFHGPIQQGYYGCDMPFLIGTSHIYRAAAMKQIGGYAPTIVEDHLTGMVFYANGWKGVFVPKVLAEGDGPLNWVDYFNQQMRWSYGLFEIIFRFTPKLFGRLNWKQKINYVSAQLYYFSGVTVVLGMLLTFLYLVFGVRAASINLLQWISYSVPPAILAIGIQIYVHRFSINPKKEPLFGLLGMFLNLGANIIYSLAFIKFITRTKLRYMVTQKGSNAENQVTRIDTFYPHIFIAIVLLISFCISLLVRHDAIQLRFWAVFNIATLFAIALSGIFITYYRRLMSHRIASILLQRIAVPIISILFVLGLFGLYSMKTQIMASVLNQDIYADFQSYAEKIQAPQTGSLLGIVSSGDASKSPDVNALNSQKNFAIISYYQAWGSKNNTFDASWASYIVDQNKIPLITWEPWEPVSGHDRSYTATSYDPYQLRWINAGKYDSYIKQYADDVKKIHKPVMIRLAHEMNGNWYPWGSTLNTPQEYVAFWQHVHDIFTYEGVQNVTWVWSPNEIYQNEQVPQSANIAAFYPGDKYVDWVGMSSFNWAGLYKNNAWRKPADMFGDTYLALQKFQKPIMIAETAAADVDGSPQLKASWIKLLASYVKQNPAIKAVVWFNAKDNGIDWSINSSSISEKTFESVFSDRYFLRRYDSVSLTPSSKN